MAVPPADSPGTSSGGGTVTGHTGSLFPPTQTIGAVIAPQVTVVVPQATTVLLQQSGQSKIVLEGH